MARRNNPQAKVRFEDATPQGHPNHDRPWAQTYSNDELTSHFTQCLEEQLHQSDDEFLHLKKKKENLSEKLTGQTTSQLKSKGDDNLLIEEDWKTRKKAPQKMKPYWKRRRQNCRQ